MRVTLTNDRTTWNQFVMANPYSEVFHLWEWGDTCEYYGYTRYYLIAENGSEIVRVLPLIHMRSIFFGNQLISMPFCEYGSPILSENANYSEIIKIHYGK
jgi:hypothetical protein